MLSWSASSMFIWRKEFRSILSKISSVKEASVEMIFFRKVIALSLRRSGTSGFDTIEAIWLLITGKNYGLIKQVL